MNIHGSALVERHAGMAAVASLAIGLRRLTIDGFGQDAGTGGFTYTPWAAKQKSMRQVVIADGIFQRSGNVFLPHNCIKGLGTVFSGRDNEFFHGEYLGDAACKVGKRARILGKPAPANAQSRAAPSGCSLQVRHRAMHIGFTGLSAAIPLAD